MPDVKTRYLNGGRIAYWDPDKGAVIIEKCDGGTGFTPSEGKHILTNPNEHAIGRDQKSLMLPCDEYTRIFQVTKELPNFPADRLTKLNVASDVVIRVTHVARQIRDAGEFRAVIIEICETVDENEEVSLTLDSSHANVKAVMSHHLVMEWYTLMTDAVSWLGPRELFLRTGFHPEEFSPLIDRFLLAE